MSTNQLELEQMSRLVSYLVEQLGNERELEELFAKKQLFMTHSTFFNWRNQKSRITQKNREMVAQFLGVEIEALEGYLAGDRNLKELFRGEDLDASQLVDKTQLILRVGMLTPKELVTFQAELLDIEIAISNKLLEADTEPTLQKLLVSAIDARGMENVGAIAQIPAERMNELIEGARPGLAEVFGLARTLLIPPEKLEEIITTQFGKWDEF